MRLDEDEKAEFKVVVNQEEEYSLWPSHRENAPGWRNAGKTGTRQECLAYIGETWTDMRPLSLRKAEKKHGTGQVHPMGTRNC